VIELSIEADDLARLETMARSRTEPARSVQRARILLAYRSDPSSMAVAAQIGVTHRTVQRCVRRAVRLGAMAALDDSPRAGKTPRITPEAQAWLVSLARRKAKELGYPHELWTTRLLACHLRAHAVAAPGPIKSLTPRDRSRLHQCPRFIHSPERDKMVEHDGPTVDSTATHRN
jgi:transposase